MDNFGPKFDPGNFSKPNTDNIGIPSHDKTTEVPIGTPDFKPLVSPKITEKQKDTPSQKTEKKYKQEIVNLIGPKGYKVSRTVFKIANEEKTVNLLGFKIPYGEQYYATGFMISENLAITNWHVFPDNKSAQDARALFGYLAPDENPNDEVYPYTSYKINPDIFFYSNEELDYAVVGVEGKPGASWGFIPIPKKQQSIPKKVIILQHPQGRPMEIVSKNNEVLSISDYPDYADEKNIILYKADTEEGSSGSPVFDPSYNLIALHHWGDTKKYELNKGHLISAIKEDLERNKIYPFR